MLAPQTAPTPRSTQTRPTQTRSAASLTAPPATAGRSLAQRHLIVPVQNLEFRQHEGEPGQLDPDVAGRVQGHAVTWTEIATIHDFFDGIILESFAPGAFADTLREDRDRIVMLSQHEPWNPIGRPDGLSEDAIGLFFASDLISTVAGADMAKLVRKGVIRGVSIGFDIVEELVERQDDGTTRRTITKARLWEISLVTWPAFRSTDVMALRSAAAEASPLAKLAGEAAPLMSLFSADRPQDDPTGVGDRGQEPALPTLPESPLDPAERSVLLAMVERRCKGSNANKARVESALEALQGVLADLTPEPADDSGDEGESGAERANDHRSSRLALAEAAARLAYARS